MGKDAAVPDSQSPTPSQGAEGTDLRTVSRQIEGLLDDEGHFNPEPGRLSRGHPDYDESADDRARAPKQRDDRGRFKAAADDDQGDEQPDVDDEEDLDIPAASDDSDEDTYDGDTDENPAESAGEEAQPDDGETGEIQTLAEFAEALEVPLDELKEAVTHTFNAAGEEITVTLSELEKGYQKDADYRRSTAKLAQEKQEAEIGFMQRHQAYEQQNHYLAASLQAAENVVAAELNDPRLAELRESDPAEWTARRDEIGSRLQQMREYRTQAAQSYQTYTEQMKKQISERERSALLQKLPDFGKQHREAAKEVLSEMGFHEREISEVVDHRLVLGVLELANLRKEVAELRSAKEKAGDAVRRVKKDIPKLTKPGKQRRSRPGLRKDNITRLRDRAAKSGKVEDAAKVIENLI